MRVTGYCYPWDVASGFGDRVGELGIDEIAVAVAYHSTRAATPWLTDRTSVLASHAALYRPVREEVWRGARLRPLAPEWVDGVDSGGRALRELRTAGSRCAAWLVLTHDSRLGTRFPDVAVRNCFDEVYPWALCPSVPEVRDYAATLAAESLVDVEVDSVILEACGQLGAVHQHQHEKTDAVWSPAVTRLLSVCCCASCARDWTDNGADATEVCDLLRTEVRRLVTGGDLGATEDGLGASLRALLLSTRQRGTDALRHAVLTAVGSGPRVVLHGSADPWATGAMPGLTPSAADAADAVVVRCWRPGPSATGEVRAARALPTDVGAYVTAVAPEPVPAMAAYVGDLGVAGASELHLYHLGLAGPARWPDIRAAVLGARTPRNG